jgi:ASC-1-like (ASCH) protein
MKCIIIDAHVNTCVFEVIKQGPKKISAITNYLIERFQALLKDHYIFHKKSIKILKTKKYKAYRGKNDEVGEYVLPEQFHVDHFEKVMKKAKDLIAK